MKNKVTGTVARRHSGGGAIGLQRAHFGIELPDVNSIHPEIAPQDELARWIGFNHVSVCAIVTANREASRWSTRGMHGTDGTGIAFHIAGCSQPPVGTGRQHRERPAMIVRYEHKLAGRMNAEVRWPRALRTDCIQPRQTPGQPVDAISRHCAGLCSFKIRDLIGGVEKVPGWMEGQPRGIQWVFKQLALRQFAGRWVHLEEIDALPSPFASFGPLR